MGKPWYKSKTIIVAAFSILIGLLTWMQGQIGAGVAITSEGIIMMILRLMTKEAVKFFGEE